MSAILRHRHPNRFTVLPNDAIRNPALSFRAVGVLAHLLSLPDGARVDSTSLAEAHKEGRDAVRAALQELAAHGYYRREIVRLQGGTLRTEVVVSSIPMDETADDTEDGFSGVGTPEPGNPASVEPAPVNQAPEEVTEQVTISPPTPPPSGGAVDASHNSHGNGGSRRTEGTNPRALGINPRAEDDRAEEARQRELAERREAELAAEVDARQADEAEARLTAVAFEAEATALSAAFDDDRLAAVVALAAEGVAGPLARSPFAVARAVVGWCRAAAERRPGPLVAAVDTAVADRWRPSPGSPASLEPLDLPAAPAGTLALRERLTPLVRQAAAGEG